MEYSFLKYPENFSTLYQNSNFDFPHDTILNLSYKELVNKFMDKNYVIPYYIKLYNPKVSDKDVTEILFILKNNESVCLLGALFMYLKGLLENVDSDTNVSGINIFEDANETIVYKSKELQNFVDIFNNYISVNTVYDFIFMISLIIDVTQNIVINVINHVTKNYINHKISFPKWLRNKIIVDFISYIPGLFNRKMKYYKGLNKTYARYIGEIIPTLLILFEKAQKFQYNYI